MATTPPEPTFAQYGQDRYVVEELLGGKKGGTFIEIGAYDGLTLSNTWLLERDYGWRGVCIEAMPETFAALKRNRACVCVHAAAAATSGGKVVFHALSGNSAMLSGRLDTQSAVHKRRIAGDLARHGNSARTVEVPTMKAADLLRHHGMTEVDYASVDVEGGELECLKGLLESGIVVHIIGIENNYGERPAHRLLKQHGYLRIRRLGSDDFYRLAAECTPQQRRDAALYTAHNWRFALKNARRNLREIARLR